MCGADIIMPVVILECVLHMKINEATSSQNVTVTFIGCFAISSLPRPLAVTMSIQDWTTDAEQEIAVAFVRGLQAHQRPDCRCDRGKLD